MSISAASRGPEAQMPNIATLLKTEITRLARKEVRESSDGLKKTMASQRTEIAGLKRRLQELEGVVKKLAKASSAVAARPGAPVLSEADESNATGLRFRAKGMAANRKRLGLSAADFGKLINASSLSVYKWEKGEVRPRERHVQAIAAIRSIGKKEAAARLEQIG